MTDPTIYKKAADKEWGRKALSNAFGATDPENAAASASVKNKTETDYVGHALMNDDERYAHLVANRTNAAALTQVQRKKDDDAKELMLEQLHRQAEEINAEWWREHIDELNDLIDQMRQKLEELQTKIAENNNVISFLTSSHTRAQIALDRFDHQQGVLERDPDGKLTDKNLQRLFEGYLANKQLNPTGAIPVTDGGIAAGIRRQIQFEQKHKINPRTEQNIQLQTQVQTTQRQLTVVEQFKQDINKILHDPEMTEAQQKAALNDVLEKAFQQDVKDWRNIKENYRSNKMFSEILPTIKLKQQNNAENSAGVEDMQALGLEQTSKDSLNNDIKISSSFGLNKN